MFAMQHAMRTTWAMSVLAIGLVASACAKMTPAPTVPDTTTSRQLSLTGSWNGTESDRLGPAILTWTLTHSGSDVSGSVVMRPVDPADGSCASCHKSKVGTVTGMLSGSTLTLLMKFPEGGTGDPTPACSITLNATLPDISDTTASGTYTGTDPCEGVFDGTIEMKRKAP
jgi:hypothetical protein